MALAMIEGAEARGALRAWHARRRVHRRQHGLVAGMVCAAKGYRFVVLSSDAFSQEKLRTMQAFGAELRLVPSDGGKVTPALFDRFRAAIKVLADGAGHVLDGSVSQRGCDRRLRRNRPRAARADRRPD